MQPLLLRMQKHLVLNQPGSCQGGVVAAVQPAAPRPHNTRHIRHVACMQHTRRPQLLLMAAGDNTNASHGGNMTPEEEAFYAEFLAKKKEERQRSLMEAARRSKLYAQRKAAAEAAAAADTGSMDPAAPSLRSGQNQPNTTVEQRKQGSQGAAASGQPAISPNSGSSSSSPARDKLDRGTTAAGPRITKAKRAGLARNTNQAARARLRRPAAAARTARPPARLQQPLAREITLYEDEDEDEDESDDEIDDDELARLDAMAADMLSRKAAPAPSNQQAGQKLQQPATTQAASSVPAPLKPATIVPLDQALEKAPSTQPAKAPSTQPAKARTGSSSSGRGSQTSVDRVKALASREAHMLAQLQALMKDDSDSDDEERMELVNMDDIDWEALQAYESFEQGVEMPPSKHAAKAAARDQSVVDVTAQPPKRSPLFPQQPGQVASSSQQATDGQALRPPPRRPQPTASSSGDKDMEVPLRLKANKSTTAKAAAAGLTAAAAAGAVQVSTQQLQQPAPFKAVLQQGFDDDDLEGLLQLLDEVELGAASEAQRSMSMATGLSTAASDDEMDLERLQQLERMLLGKDWQRELAGISQANSSGATAADAEQAPWLDEVTSLLVGLVVMSAKRYLDIDLIPGDEESRAAGVWDAPWALLVIDDTPRACLEYANKKALQLLGVSDFVDIYDISIHDLLPQQATDKQTWLRALKDIEDRRVDLATLNNAPLLTTVTGVRADLRATHDVQVFTVDNLDEGRCGTAVLIREHQA